MIALIAALTLPGAAIGAEAKGTAEFVADDVCALAMLDFTKIDIPEAAEQLIKLGLIAEPQFEEARGDAGAVQAAFDEFTNLGVRRVYMLVRTSDVQSGGPTWIIETAGGDAPQRLRERLRPSQDQPRPGALFNSLPPAAYQAPNIMLLAILDRAVGDFLPREFAIVDDMLLCARTPEQLAAMKEHRRTTIREEAAPRLRRWRTPTLGW